jgi:O-antigen ligase
VYRLQILAVIGTTFLTASRGGTLCMMIALSLILWTLGSLPMRNRIGIVAVMILTVIGAVAVIPATSWKRLASAADEVSQGTLNSRTVLWKAGLDEFQTHSIGGIGAGSYPEASAKVIGRPWAFVPVAHNSFISVMVETGLIGFGIFGAMLAMLFRSAWALTGITRSFWLTLLCVWIVGVCSLTWEYRKPTWLLFGLVAAHVARLQAGTRVPVETSMKRSRYFDTAEAYS